MKGIRWIKSHPYNFGSNIHNYNAEIGHICLCCRPYTKHSRNGKIHIIGWVCFIYCGDKQIGETKIGPSLDFTQRKAERLAFKYLYGDGFVVLKALKRVGVLEEMLSEVGIDL